MQCSIKHHATNQTYLNQLNGGLFIVTLIIMCRISRPGSTRPEMSIGNYFKAAGTLVLLYGAHYTLIAYRPTNLA